VIIPRWNDWSPETVQCGYNVRYGNTKRAPTVVDRRMNGDDGCRDYMTARAAAESVCTCAHAWVCCVCARVWTFTRLCRFARWSGREVTSYHRKPKKKYLQNTNDDHSIGVIIYRFSMIRLNRSNIKMIINASDLLIFATFF